MSKLIKAIVKITDKEIKEYSSISPKIQELQGRYLEVVLDYMSHGGVFISTKYNPSLKKYLEGISYDIALLDDDEFTILMEIPYESD